MDRAPAAVRWALGLACLSTLVAAGMGVALAFDADLSWGVWDNVSVGAATVKDAGWPAALASTLAFLAYGVFLVVGLVDQRRWGQFMGVILFGGAAGQTIVDLASGGLNLLAPFLVWLSWALFRSNAWFVGPQPEDGPAPLATAAS